MWGFGTRCGESFHSVFTCQIIKMYTLNTLLFNLLIIRSIKLKKYIHSFLYQNTLKISMSWHTQITMTIMIPIIIVEFIGTSILYKITQFSQKSNDVGTKNATPISLHRWESEVSRVKLLAKDHDLSKSLYCFSNFGNTDMFKI